MGNTVWVGTGANTYLPNTMVTQDPNGHDRRGARGDLNDRQGVGMPLRVHHVVHVVVGGRIWGKILAGGE